MMPITTLQANLFHREQRKSLRPWDGPGYRVETGAMVASAPE